jgi:hypothetical protein
MVARGTKLILEAAQWFVIVSTFRREWISNPDVHQWRLLLHCKKTVARRFLLLVNPYPP